MNGAGPPKPSGEKPQYQRKTAGKTAQPDPRVSNRAETNAKMAQAQGAGAVTDTNRNNPNRIAAANEVGNFAGPQGSAVNAVRAGTRGAAENAQKGAASSGLTAVPPQQPNRGTSFANTGRNIIGGGGKGAVSVANAASNSSNSFVYGCLAISLLMNIFCFFKTTKPNPDHQALLSDFGHQV